MSKKTAEERFMEKVRKDQVTGCWTWIGAVFPSGYGMFKFEGENWRAHRWAYMTFVGGPGDLLVCHSCDVPGCVNPKHLWLGTNADNTQDSLTKGRLATGDRHGSRTKPESRPRGENHRSAKLTWEAARAIRARFAAGGVTQVALAAEYGVSFSLISRVVHRETWIE